MRALSCEIDGRFAIPMRGNERIGADHDGTTLYSFAIPMRGNEVADWCGVSRCISFAIPMRGNEM